MPIRSDVYQVSRRLSIVPAYESNRSHHIRSLLIFIATLALAAGALIAKWRVLQPIHNEIVGKFNRKEPLYFERHSVCRVFDIREDFNIITFPCACFLIVIFSLTTKRVSFQKGLWFKGYIGLPIPMDFCTGVKRTFPTVVFAIFADELIGIVSGMFRRTSDSSDGK